MVCSRGFTDGDGLADSTGCTCTAARPPSGPLPPPPPPPPPRQRRARLPDNPIRVLSVRKTVGTGQDKQEESLRVLSDCKKDKPSKEIVCRAVRCRIYTIVIITHGVLLPPNYVMACSRMLSTIKFQIFYRKVPLSLFGTPCGSCQMTEGSTSAGFPWVAAASPN